MFNNNLFINYIINKILILFILNILFNCISLSQTVFRTNVTMAQGYMDDWRLGKKLSAEIGSMFELNSKFNIDTLNIQFVGRTSLGFLFEDSDQMQRLFSFTFLCNKNTIRASIEKSEP